MLHVFFSLLAPTFFRNHLSKMLPKESNIFNMIWNGQNVYIKIIGFIGDLYYVQSEFLNRPWIVVVTERNLHF